MDPELPASLTQIAQCYSCDQLEDGRSLIGLCTTSGQFLEIVDKQIVESVDLDSDANDIKVFTSYNPVQKYFLIRCKNTLIVIKRDSPLSIIKKFDNVLQVVVQDRLRIGRPQAVIWTLTDQEPIVTDFVGQLQPSGPQCVPQLSASLSRKLQEMNLRLTKAHKLLKEKQVARLDALYQVTPHLQPPENQTEGEPKILVWGPPFPSQDKILLPPLKLSLPWGRCHNGRWVIGIPVFNSGTLVVKDLRLRLQMDSQQELSHETHLVVLPERQSTGAEWMEPRYHRPLMDRRNDIPGLSSAVVVGILDEPVFKKTDVISITGAIFYKQSGTDEEKSFQDILSSAVEFKVEDLIHGRLKPFVSLENCEESDVISTAVINDCRPLILLPRHCLPTLATPLHLSAHGLQEVPTLHCWVGLPHGSLDGLMVMHTQLEGSQHRLDLYATNTKQAFQLVHSLSTQWIVTLLKSTEVNLQSCVKNLAAELKLLRTTALPDGRLSPGKWAEFRKQLSSLELKTDLSFVSYSPD